MTMRARAGAAIFLGIAVGLFVVASTAYLAGSHPGASQYDVRLTFLPTLAPLADGSSSPVATYGTGSTFSTASPPMLASQVNNFASQPPVQSAIVFLPVVAAVLFGLLLYRASTSRIEEPRRGTA